MSTRARGQRVTVWPPDRYCGPTATVDLHPPAWTGFVLAVDGELVSVHLDDGRTRWFFRAEVVDA